MEVGVRAKRWGRLRGKASSGRLVEDGEVGTIKVEERVVNC